MSRFHELPPSASSLAISLRDLGYSLETAVADIVDNSIDACSSEINIICDLSLEPPALCIIDNGNGMTLNELISALRHGATGTHSERLPTDLGRFGLGLKTASFSQAKKLTVVSRKNGETNGAEWDLDRVVQEDRWLIEELTDSHFARIPHIDLLPDHGTMVVWSSLDRLFEDEVGLHRDELVNAKLANLRDHLSLVFHRFLEGDAHTGKLSILVNRIELEPFDPFCRDNKATQRLPKDVVPVQGHRVEIESYILPHHSRLSEKEYRYYSNRSDFISNQGAYVYRNCRLMAWGDWFRLVPKGESTKLGRVKIDFPSALDEAWTIDIKKSRAHPPRAVKNHLRQILQKITGAATSVHKSRGKKLYEENVCPLWERYADQGKIKYVLNSDHPLIFQLRNSVDPACQEHLATLLEAIPASLPIDYIYSDYSIEPRSLSKLEAEDSEMITQLRRLKKIFPDLFFTDPTMFQSVAISTKLFGDKLDMVKKFAKGEIE